MAKKFTRKKDGRRAGLIAGGVTFALFSLLFGFGLFRTVIGGGLAFAVGALFKTMATPLPGLDKNSKARDDLNVIVIEDEYARSVIEEGVRMLDALKKERAAINEYVFTRRINDLRGHYDKLLRAVIADTGKASRIRKFNTYYVPTAVKVMQGYREKKANGTSYMTMSATRDDILKMLDDLNAAALKLHETMLQADLEDMDVEMDVFDRMLRSDGLAKDELVEDMRASAHEAAKQVPMSNAPTVKPTSAAPVRQKPVQKPVVKAAAPAEAPRPAEQPEPAAKQPEPAHIIEQVNLDYHPEAQEKERTPVPTLQLPVTASAAQMAKGTPVLHVPNAPEAPDFSDHPSQQEINR